MVARARGVSLSFGRRSGIVPIFPKGKRRVCCGLDRVTRCRVMYRVRCAAESYTYMSHHVARPPICRHRIH